MLYPFVARAIAGTKLGCGMSGTTHLVLPGASNSGSAFYTLLEFKLFYAAEHSSAGRLQKSYSNRSPIL